MRGVRIVFCALALGAAFLVSGARADEYTKETFLTFSGPVQLPGVTLPAGTYMFKLADPDSGRRTLQVRDKEGTKIFAMLLTIPDERMEASDKPVVMFTERPAGQAQAIKAWFYPGERYGQEFVYPKEQAMKIARAAHTSVLAFSDEKHDNEAAMRSAKVERIDESGAAADTKAAAKDTAQSSSTTTAPGASTTTANQTAANATPAPSANRTQSNAVASPHPSAETAERRADAAGTKAVGTTGAQTLPKTASPLTLIELLSVLTLAGGFGVRQLRKRFVDVQ